MRTISLGGLCLAFAVGVVAGAACIGRVSAQVAAPAIEETQCGSATPQVRTTLYFGLARPKGAAISELEWQLFLRDQVTTRFPDGLTVWEAEGQWRGASNAIEHERSKVLLLVHPDTAQARASIQEVVTRYRQAFDQESVLWETSRVCAAS